MRIGTMAGVLVLGLAAGVFAGDIYRWTDAKGQVHFSNVPVSSGDQRGLVSEEEAPPIDTASATAEPSGSAAETPEQADASAEASLRRQALERELRETQAELRDVDRQLAEAAKLRTRFAKGTEATGGLGTRAENVRTPEEDQLAAKRAQLAKHAEELRQQYEELRAEVTRSFGGTPDWWVDLR
jgi:hypothetical protein